MTEILDYHEMSARVKQRVNSRKWWVLVDADSINPIVESRYYTGNTSHLFEILLIPYPLMFSISFAHKSAMTYEQLIECVVEAGAQRPSDGYEDNDLLLCGSPQTAQIFIGLVGEDPPDPV